MRKGVANNGCFINWAQAATTGGLWETRGGGGEGGGTCLRATELSQWRGEQAGVVTSCLWKKVRSALQLAAGVSKQPRLPEEPKKKVRSLGRAPDTLPGRGTKY